MLDGKSNSVSSLTRELQTLLNVAENEHDMSKQACTDEEQRLLELSCLGETMKAECDEIEKEVQEQSTRLSTLREQPQMYEEEMRKVESATMAIQTKINSIEQNKREVIADIELQKQRTAELEKQTAAEQKRLEDERSVLARKRQQTDDLVKDLENERVRQHSLASRRIELEINLKTTAESIRHNNNFLTVDNRQVNAAKSTLAKKLQATAKVKASLPQKKAKLKDLQRDLDATKAEKNTHEQTLAELRSQVDIGMIRLLEQVTIDDNQQCRLDETARSVAQREGEVEKMRVEEKKASTVATLMKEKRATTRRKLEKAEQMKFDIESEIRFQQIQELDITKTLKDATKQQEFFKYLHDMIKSEKMECSTLVETTNKALSDMKQRCKTLRAHVRSLTTERDDKTEALRLLRKELETSQGLRASSRRGKSLAWTQCRDKMATLSIEEARIQTLRSTLVLAQKEVERLKLQNDHMAWEKQSMLEQLSSRKTQLSSLFNTAAVYVEVLKRGELACHQMSEEMKKTEIVNRDIQRSIDLIVSQLRNQSDDSAILERTQAQLEFQILETARISRELESPTQERFNALPGHHPSKEELLANLKVLEKLERKNRETLRSKELSINITSQQITELETESKDWKAATQFLLNAINDYQGRVHELKKTLTSQRGEIQMYSDLIDKMSDSKVDLEKDIGLREQLVRERINTPSSYSAPSSPKRHVVERLRPTAYMPSDNDTIQVPRPYGMPPFQPTGTMIRHIRQPQPMTINYN